MNRAGMMKCLVYQLEEPEVASYPIILALKDMVF